MIITPNLSDAPCVCRDGVKYFELVAEEVRQEVLPDLFLAGYGYNGSIPGPTVICRGGDCVNIRLVNKLPEETSFNVKGLTVANDVNGIPLVDTSPVVRPGETFDYRFQVRDNPGTHIYCSGTNPSRQQALGMCGAFCIDDGRGRPNQDFCFILQEFRVPQLRPGQLVQGTYNIDPQGVNGNFYCINGKCFPATAPCDVMRGCDVRLRFCNVSNATQPMLLSGHPCSLIATDGRRLPERICKSCVNVGCGETVDCAFCASNPGEWPLCNQRPCAQANNFTQPLGGMCTTIEYS